MIVYSYVKLPEGTNVALVSIQCTFDAQVSLVPLELKVLKGRGGVSQGKIPEFHGGFRWLELKKHIVPIEEKMCDLSAGFQCEVQHVL